MQMRVCQLAECILSRRSFSSACRLSCPTESNSAKAYASTLLLPKTKFKLWANPTQRENEILRRTTEGLYAWQWANNKGDVFILHDGPPYANGELHMGHALNKVLKDMANRFRVLQGCRVNYIPGWDCHGLPIEAKALEKLEAKPNTLPAPKVRVEAEKFAKTQIAIQRAEFQSLGIMANWSENGTYRTLDHNYEMRQLRVFQDMVKKNLVYRKHRPVHWSPSSVSALAEAELQYSDDHVSHAAYIAFRVPSLDDMSADLKTILSSRGISEANLLIWTTTPWTIPANMGIAVNPDLTYSIVTPVQGPMAGRPVIVAEELLDSLKGVLGAYFSIISIKGNSIVGTKYSHAFTSTAPLRVIPSRHVSSTSGTGLVHMAPAHGLEDHLAFLEAGLLTSHESGITDALCPVDEYGRFSHDIMSLAPSTQVGERLYGKSVLDDGNAEMIAVLREYGMLVHDHKYRHRYPYDSRTRKPMIIRATSQWFVHVGDIKDDTLEAIKNVEFHPEASRARMESFVRERSEWCISRQRVWGIPIPSIHNTRSGETLLRHETLEHIFSILDKKGVAYWWTGDVKEFLPKDVRDSDNTADWVKGTDTIDVWFDSGTSWTMLRSFGTDEHITPADACLEGSDQHRGWFQSMLLTAVASRPEGSACKAPFRHLITHGFVLDEKGRKMSKSIGNVLSPSVVVSGGKDKNKHPAYGVDVLRLWAATVDSNKDVVIGHKLLAQVSDTLRRIRNTFRFLLANTNEGAVLDHSLYVSKQDMTITDRYVMHQLYTLNNLAELAFQSFNFQSLIPALVTFMNSTLSALYFDITKDTLYAEPPNDISRRAVITVLLHVLDQLTTIVAPIVPFLAEEVHETRQLAAGASSNSSVFETGWKHVDAVWEDHDVLRDMNCLLNVRNTVLGLLERARGQGDLRSSLEALVNITSVQESEGEVMQLSRCHMEHLSTLFIVSDVSLGSQTDISAGRWCYQDTRDGLTISIRPPVRHKCPRCWQWRAIEPDHLCDRCSTVISRRI